MNKQILPWVRKWEQIDLDLELENGRQQDDQSKAVLAWVTFIALCLCITYIFMDGVLRTAALDQAYADGARMGRLELLQRVKQETEREGKTWTAFYRAASKAGMSGFDGVVLVEAKP